MDHETGVIDTITPSEPVLARAAMEHLCGGEAEDDAETEDDAENKDNTETEDNTETSTEDEDKTENENWSSSIRTLCKELLEKGLIEKGRKGELYARLLLTLAHDWVRRVSAKTFAPTFSVSNFLMALYAGDHHDSIRKIPNRILEARMNFTHFLPAGEKLTAEVIPELCHDLLRRSAAMQLSWEQVTYDLLIPVYYGSEDEEFDPSKCGVVLVQVKNQMVATTPREIFQEDFIKVSPEASNPATLKASSQRKPEKFVFNQMANPILFLLFDLGVIRSDRATSPLVQVLQSNSGLQPDLWGIHSRGHDETVFGCLKHMNAIKSSKRFFTATQKPKTPADQLCLRNRPFHQLRRSFRYEMLEQEDTSESGEGSSGADTGAQEEEASSTGKSKDKRPRRRVRDFIKTSLPFRKHKDQTGR